jgi:WD40 repeat protein
MRIRVLLAVSCLAVQALAVSGPGDPAPVPGKGPANGPKADGHGDPLPAGAVARLGTLRWRTTESADLLTFSPDGKRVASADRSCVRLWEVGSGKELGIAAVPYCTLAAFTRDGKHLVIAPAQELLLLDGHTARTVGAYPLPGNATAIVPHPTQDLVAVLTRQGDVVLARTDKPGGTPHTLNRQRLNLLLAGTWSADGATLIVGDVQGVLSFFGPGAARRGVRSVAREGRTVHGLAAAPDGKALQVFEGGATLWVDAVTGKTLRSFQPHVGASAWWLSPDGCRLAAGRNGDERIVHIWDTQTGQLLHTSRHPLVTHGRDIGLAFAPDGTVGANADGRLIVLWDVRTGKPLAAGSGHSTPIEELSFRAGGREVVTSAADGLAAVWDAATGKLLRQIRHDDSASHRVPGCVTAGGSVLVTRSKGFLSCWDVATGKAERCDLPTGDSASLRGVGLSGHTIVLGSTAGVMVLDRATGQVRHKLQVSNPVGHLLLAPDGRRLAEFWDGLLAVWDVATGKRLWQLKEPQVNDYVFALAWTPDSRQLLVERSHLQDGERFAFLDADTGEPRGRLDCWDGGFQHVAFSADGRLLATASKKGVVRLWELATRLPLGQFTPKRLSHNGPAQDYRHVRLAFDPSGLRLAAGVEDGTVLVYFLPLLFASGGAPVDGKAWEMLAGGDGKAAFALMLRLSQRPAEAMALLRERLAPAPVVAEQRLQELLADLDAGDFVRRDGAARELLKLGDAAEAALRALAAKPPSLEARRRAELVLKALDQRFRQFPSPAVRTARALQVLESIGSEEARQLLEALAKGDPRAGQTQLARDALERLKAR